MNAWISSITLPEDPALKRNKCPKGKCQTMIQAKSTHRGHSP